MKLDAEWIHRPVTQAVCKVLTDAGHQAFFVGGCVRNSFIHAPVDDIDLTTDARPDRVIEVMETAGLKTVPTGIDHGTVTVVAEHVPHEITTFRKDVETHGRHATVRFADTMEEDAHRRDFTMNALYARPDGTLVDPLGGLPDLVARRVRFIDDPSERIREDYLRILRFFRFHAWYGDAGAGLDADGLAAVADHVDGLDRLSRERVGAEIVKLLGAPDPAPSVAAMRVAGVLARVLPGSDDRALPLLVHAEQLAGVPPHAMRRLAALGPDDPRHRLRLSRAQCDEIRRLRDAARGPTPPAVLGYRLGMPAAQDALLLRSAVFETVFDPKTAEDAAFGATREFPVTARDLMPGLTGPALGERLREMEDRWIASGFTLSKQALLS